MNKEYYNDVEQKLKQQTVSGQIEHVVMCTSEKAVRKLARIVFTHGYSLGAFAGSNDKKEQGYNMMLKHMIDKNIHDDEVRKLLEALYL